jgi:methyl-accepting chemotaxis protein
MKIKLRTKLLAGFIAVAVIGGFIGIFGLINLRNLDNADTFMFEKAATPLGYVARIVEYIQRARVNLYKIVLADSPEVIEEYANKVNDYMKIVDENIEKYRDTYINDDDRRSWENYIETKKAFTSYFEKIITLARNNMRTDAIALLDGKASEASDITNEALDKIINLNVEGAKTISEGNTDLANQTSMIMIAITVIGFIISIILAIWLGVYVISKPLMRISETLKNGSGQIATASNQLSSSSQEIANGATEQASSIEETTSSMEELASMVKQNVTNAQEASNLAEKASINSKDGYAQMEKMLESMTEINKSSDQIKKIIKVIDDIAFQTNILALNAAVEAARAGEAGMGFAVVADEVKNLANRSAEAAKETSSMIEDSIKRTESGVQIASKLAEVFKEILSTVQKVTEMTREVETASKQQDSGINQVNRVIVQFDEVVQANASSAEETASSAEELLAQVENLNDIVKQLVLLVSGKMMEMEISHTNVRQQAGHYKEAKAVYEVKKKLQEGAGQKTGRQLTSGRQLASGHTSAPVGVKKREISPERVIPFEEDEDLKE